MSVQASKKGMKKANKKVKGFWKKLSKKNKKSVKKATKKIGWGGKWGKAKKAAKKLIKVAKKTAKKGWGFKGKAKKSYGKRRKVQKRKAKAELKAKVAKIGAGAVWKKLWKVSTCTARCNECVSSMYVHGNTSGEACRFDAAKNAAYFGMHSLFVQCRSSHCLMHTCAGI